MRKPFSVRAVIFTCLVFLGLIMVAIFFTLRQDRTSSNFQGGDEKIKVVATTTQLEDFAKNIAGDKVSLYTIYRSNADIHEYELTPADARALSDAELILQNGAKLEAKLEDSITENTSALLFTAAEFVELRENGEEHNEDEHADETDYEKEGDDHEHGAYDPHIWFSVANTKKIVTGLAQKLIDADPGNKDFYTDNLEGYLVELDMLDNYIYNNINKIPAENRKIVTSHEVFGYYTDEYGLELAAAIIPSSSTEAGTSAQGVASLIRLIKNENIKAIFTDNSVNPNLAEQIGTETGAKVISDLYGDSLGEPGSNGDTYLKMMRHNTDRIVSALL